MGDALAAARASAAGLNPEAAASRVDAEWDDVTLEFRLPSFGRVVSVTYPAYEVSIGDEAAPAHIAALVVYHLALSDGSLPTGTWISFADLPDGSFYVSAFRGYASGPIIRRFSPGGSGLSHAAMRLGGTALPGLADRAWRIPALPRMPLALLWWDADEEFDARVELLFDSTAPHHLNTEGCAILGSWLTSLLVSAID